MINNIEKIVQCTNCDPEVVEIYNSTVSQLTEEQQLCLAAMILNGLVNKPQSSICVNIVIDTKYIKKNYPNPSKDKDNPTNIDDVNTQFMIVNYEQAISGQASANLHFQAKIGDIVSFTGGSIDANSSDAVIVYGITYLEGDRVFGDFSYNLKTLDKAVMPIQDNNGLPPVQVSRNFMSLNAKVNNSGQESLYVKIAVYEQQDSEQILYGYFQWTPSITITVSD